MKRDDEETELEIAEMEVEELLEGGEVAKREESESKELCEDALS